MKQVTVALIAAFLSIGWFLVHGFVQTSSGFHGRKLAFHKLKGPPQCSQQQQRRHLERYVAVDRQFSTYIQDNSSSSVNSDDSRSHVQSLWLFVHNIQKERREKRLQTQTVTKQQRQQKQQQHTKQQEQRVHHPAKSLVSFLHHNTLANSKTATTNNSPLLLVEPFSRAVVQAIRLASELGDYKLIIHLVEASIQYANEQPILIPRLFGEAIDGISKTPANIAKIKQLWMLGTSEEARQVLREPLGAFELNVMIKAIASRGKIRAALDLYRETTADAGTAKNDTDISFLATTCKASIVPDAYTLSSIFSALHDSITDDQALTSANESFSDGMRHGSLVYSSRCWQWNEAMSLLRGYMEQESWPPLNNHVFSNLLKLNDRVSKVYSPSFHNGPHVALSLLNIMHQLKISPDTVTCTLVISNLGYQWKTAVNLLYAMKTAPADTGSDVDDDASARWRLPRPNVYTYSAAITVCAHCHQYQVAMELLQEMKKDDSLDSPNTWVYNAALLATTRSDSPTVLAAENTTIHQHSPKHPAQRQKHSRNRLFMALKLLREMQDDSEANCSPDTVTYNTVLATLDGIAGHRGSDTNAIQGFEDQFATVFDGIPMDIDEGGSFEELTVHRLLDEMESRNIMRDSITYRNAILAVRFSDNMRASVWRILDRAIADENNLSPISNSRVQHFDRRTGRISAVSTARQLEGKAAEGISFVFDTALSVLASHGDTEGVLQAFTKLLDHTKGDTPQTIAHKCWGAQVYFVQSLGHSIIVQGSGNRKGLIPIFLDAVKGDRVAKLDVSKRYVSIDERLFQPRRELDEAIFSAAISSCLVADDINSAKRVLAMMREEGLQPSDASLQEIARTYASLAILAASEKTKNSVVKRPQKAVQGRDGKKEMTSLSDSESLAKVRALNAFIIATKTVSDPSPGLLSTVARTCATVGLWSEARSILRLLHKRIPSDINSIASFGGATQTVLPSLQRALLRASSIQGNVTAALWYVEDIQKLTKRISKASKAISRRGQFLFTGEESSFSEDDDNAVPLSFSSGSALEALTMTAEDWKLVLIAASKCGHWRVCLSTLQFLRPYLEETHPSSLGITVEERNRRYRHLAPALTVAVKCLEVRSQYGWAVRAIDDWIEWCGRRPPIAAVLAAVRVLSSRGRGSEVNNLLARCTSPESFAMLPYNSNEGNYELTLYVGAISALHGDGLYDDADDAFVAAVSGDHLPFDVYSEELEGEGRLVLDLHGMNVPVAHSAVRVALQQEVEASSWSAKLQRLHKPEDQRSSGIVDMVIVTGRGRNSALRMRPVLRPEVQRMLLEEFYPPLSTTSIPGNMGAVKVQAADIGAWLSHQRRQKGYRMLAVASVLKNVSSMDRLKQSIARARERQAAEDKRVSNGDANEL